MTWWGRWFCGGLASGMLMFQIGFLFHKLVSAVAPGVSAAYANESLFRPWGGWTSTYMALHPFGFGFLFAGVFLLLRAKSAFPGGPRGGFLYGCGLFVVGALPVYLLAFASFRMPTAVLISWLLQSFAQYSLAGAFLGAVVDGIEVSITSILPAPPERVWNELQKTETFLFVTDGMMSFADTDSWPEIMLEQGKVMPIRLRLWGVGPHFPHVIRFVEVNPQRRLVQTEEQGGFVRVWDHRITVELHEGGTTRYTDRLELQAGVLTPFIRPFATAFYRHRQRRWREWLEIRNRRE